jgi:hypothetical protein
MTVTFEHPRQDIEVQSLTQAMDEIRKRYPHAVRNLEWTGADTESPWLGADCCVWSSAEAEADKEFPIALIVNGSELAPGDGENVVDKNGISLNPD